MIKKCAYCPSHGPFTREHVIPSFLYKKYNDHKFGYNSNAERFIDGERVVKDVCEFCNNEVLGQLDEYGKNFLDENNNNRIRLAGEKVRIRYDYNILLRWLLKLCYNGIRSTNQTDNFIKETVPYIIGDIDKLDNTYLFFQVLQSHKLSKREKDLIKDDLPNIDFFPHYSFRYGRVEHTIISQQSYSFSDYPHNSAIFSSL